MPMRQQERHRIVNARIGVKNYLLGHVGSLPVLFAPG
jgi:hypothetical protein